MLKLAMLGWKPNQPLEEKYISVKILYFQWKTFISIVNVFAIGRHKLCSYFLFEKMLFEIWKSHYTLWASLVAQTVKKSGNAGDGV